MVSGLYSYLLVVDDDCRAAGLVQTMLCRQFVRVVHALDGQSALSLLRARSFNAALIDLRLPGLSGWEVARQVRDAGYTLPLWITSAQYTQADVPHRLLASVGAQGFLPKPIHHAALIAALGPHLQPADRQEIPLKDGQAFARDRVIPPDDDPILPCWQVAD